MNNTQFNHFISNKNRFSKIKLAESEVLNIENYKKRIEEIYITDFNFLRSEKSKTIKNVSKFK